MCSFGSLTYRTRPDPLRLNAAPEQDTWWSNRGQSWAKNVGWRLDYQLATPRVATTAQRESAYLAQRFTDHAPVIVACDFKL